VGRGFSRDMKTGAQIAYQCAGFVAAGIRFNHFFARPIKVYNPARTKVAGFVRIRGELE
jgi:hypothetical protein